MSASVNFPLYHKVQKFSSGTGFISDIAIFVLKRDVKLQLTDSSTGSPRWSWRKGHKTVVVWWWVSKVVMHLACSLLFSTVVVFG